MTANHAPDPIDQHVGEKIRQGRKMLRQSQEQLAAALGLTFQQVQKYERGTNRVSCSKLLRIARSQGQAITYYFEGLAGVDPTQPPPASNAIVHQRAMASLLAVPAVARVAAMPAEHRRLVADLINALAPEAAETAAAA
ncbi:MAG: helix-turn-helix domain-containing protein [Caulobacteraceae bacterium]